MTRGVNAEPITDLNDVRNETWHGYFDRDGCWVRTGKPEDFVGAGHGSITRGVRQLVWLRRNAFPEISPRDAAMLIEQHGLGSAFPSRNEWVDVPVLSPTTGDPLTLEEQWILAKPRTGAEAAVVFAGLGMLHTQGHAGPPVSPEAVRDLVAKRAAALALQSADLAGFSPGILNPTIKRHGADYVGLRERRVEPVS